MPNVSAAIAHGGTLVELVAAVVVVWHVLRALTAIVLRRSSDEARLILAEGVLAALTLTVAGTLLKTIGLQSWTQIRTFVSVYLLRTLLKQVFLRERTLIARRSSRAPA